MAEHHRIQTNLETGLPDIRDFDEFGDALRSMASDQETVEMSDSMGELSAIIEKVGFALAQGQPGTMVGPLLVDLLTALRKHRQKVVALSESWRSLYEYAAYLGALNNFRVLVGQWLVERNISGDPHVVIPEFEMIGWRTLGEGLLLIDMHEQARSEAIEELGAPSPINNSRLARAKQWLGRLRG